MFAINIFEWMREKVFKVDMKGNVSYGTGNYTCLDMKEAAQEFYVRELAFQSAITMIANAVSKCEFKTFKAGKEIKGDLYYLWNLSPNNNQNSSVFIHKLIAKLHENNEALVIERAMQLLAADSYSRTGRAITGDRFTDIVVDDLTINTYFNQKDVLLFRLNNQNIRCLLDGLVISYTRLIESARKDYQWGSGRHGTMKIDTMPDGSEEWLDGYQAVIKNQVEPYLKNDNSVLPLFKGYEWEEYGNAGRAQRTTRDIKALIDDVYELTAKAFGIPPVLLKGEVQGTGDAVDNFLTFCIDPLCDQLEEEINRKVFGLEGFKNGDYMHIDTSKIKHFDLFANSTSVDKLISSGAYSVNDIRIAAGDTEIDEEWANRHFITKNYIEIGQMAELGGEATG